MNNTQENNIPETALTTSQILITGITWNNKQMSQYNRSSSQDLPTQFVLDIPTNILKKNYSSDDDFKDDVETFVYNFLSKHFNHEVYHCQIWLPLNK